MLKILFFFYVFISSVLLKTIPIQYIHDYSERISIFFSIGYPHQDLDYPINTILNYTQIPSTLYKESISNHVRILPNTTLYFENLFQANSYTYIDDFIFGENENNDMNTYSFIVKDLTFYVSRTPFMMNFIGLGFGMHFDNQNASIVHNLFNSNQIDKRCFAVKPSTKEILLGDVYSTEASLISQMNYASSCSSSYANSASWNCLLKDIYINNKHQSYINNVVYFNTNQYWFFLSKELFTIIESYIREIKEQHKNYEYVLKKDEYRSYIQLSKELIQFLQPIQLKFNNMQIQINFTQMFECPKHMQLCESLFASDGNEPKRIEFGKNFITMFNLTVFNYDTKSLTFYSDNIQIINNNNDGINVLYISVIIATLCIIGAGFLYYIIIYTKQT